jgi:hypothetical protein
MFGARLGALWRIRERRELGGPRRSATTLPRIGREHPYEIAEGSLGPFHLPLVLIKQRVTHNLDKGGPSQKSIWVPTVQM